MVHLILAASSSGWTPADHIRRVVVVARNGVRHGVRGGGTGLRSNAEIPPQSLVNLDPGRIDRVASHRSERNPSAILGGG